MEAKGGPPTQGQSAKGEQQFEGESVQRQLPLGWEHFLLGVGLIMTIAQVWLTLFEPIDPWPFRNMHFTLSTTIGLLLYAGWKGARRQVHWVDIALIAANLAVGAYLLLQWEPMIYRAGFRPNTADVVFGGLAVLLVLEMTRRSTGPVLPLIALVALAYQMLGGYLPSPFWHRGHSFSQMISHQFSTQGIYGPTLGASATFVFLFILFGAFLQASGTGQLIMDFAYAVAGRARGGPAKIAIVSSALFGTMSGSAVANVMITGCFTIPLMKRVGYSPRFAAGVESLASSGGALVPPVMGSTAFIMAEFLNIPYGQIAVAALLPALLYFFSLYWMIDFEAVKRKLKGLPRHELPKMGQVLRRDWFKAIPIVVLFVTLMVQQMPAQRSAALAIVATILTSWLSSDSRIGPRALLRALASAPRSIVEIASVCACAGLVMGVITATGLGIKIGNMLAVLGGGSLLLALIAAAVLSILLGMAVPAVAAYVIVAGTIAPHIVRLGVDPLATHLFVFYFAVVSSFTPPVAIAAYAAASIARTSPFGAGLTASRLGIAAYIVPFMFVYGPQLLLRGSPVEILLVVISASLGCYALAVAAQGWMAGPVGAVPRLAALGSALLLIKPGLETDLIGFVTVALIYLWSRHTAAMAKKTAVMQEADIASV